MTARLRVVGGGRAGRSLAGALAGRGWEVASVLGRGDDVTDAARDVDLLVIATPDAVVAEVARAVVPAPGTVVAHLAGSLGLDVLAGHPRVASLHPLVSLPDPEVGAARLEGAWFAVAGDPLARQVAEALGGRVLEVADDQRAAYHAAACIAANHLVALLAQVERVGATVGVPLAAYLDLARGALANAAQLGPVGALTGPAARGDEATLDRHRAALGPAEVDLYDVLAAECQAIAAGRRAGPEGSSGG